LFFLLSKHVHVKGHQDKDPNWVLTAAEQHNVDCDRRVKQYTMKATKLSMSYGNPAISDAQPHLYIQGKLICRNLLQELRHVLNFPPYSQYLQTKFQWTIQDANDIHWEITATALKTYNHEDQRRIILFINNKLPLLDSKAHPHHGSHLCPSCQRQQEDARHFLECSHPARTALFNALHHELIQLSQHLRLHPCVLTTVWLGLNTIRNATPYPDIFDDVLPQFRPPILQQAKLSWDQLYYGRLSRAWASAINVAHPHLDKSGEQVMTLIVKLTWKFILAIWTLRNQH